MITSTCPRTNYSIDKFSQFAKIKKERFIETFPRSQHFTSSELIEVLKSSKVAIVGDDQLDKVFFEKNKSLNFVIKWGSGTDNIDYKAAKANNVEIFNTPNILGKYVAEYVVGLIITNIRRINEYNNDLKFYNLWNKNSGFSLFEKTVGIFGFGDVGKEVYKLLKPFNCNVIYNDLKKKNNYSARYVNKKELIQSSDILILSASSNHATNLFIDRNELKQLKDKVLIVNIARGSLISQTQLFKELEKRDSIRLCLDVFIDEPPKLTDNIIKNNKVILTQHNASNSIEAINAVNEHIIKLLERIYK